MKKSLCVALFVCPVSCVHAQNSVTLYGSIDNGIAYVTNVHGSHQVEMVTGGAYRTSRWGLKGVEDLGGGLTTIFTIEAGFDPTTGSILQGGSEFGRQAFVGLSSSAGTVTLGRQYPIPGIFVGPLQSGTDWAASGSMAGTHPGDVDNLSPNNRVNNDVRYVTPTYRGLTFGADYGFGNQPGSMGKNQIWSLAAKYESNRVVLAASYQHINTPNFSFFGNEANSSAVNNNFALGVVASGYATAADQQIVSAGGSYALGPVTVALVYSNTQFKGLGSVPVANVTAVEAAYRGTATFNTGEVNIKYQVTPDLLLGFAYHYTRDSGVGQSAGAKYQQENVGLVYSLSKTTGFYAFVAHQLATGINSTGGPAVGAITGFAPSNSHVQTVTLAGIYHSF